MKFARSIHEHRDDRPKGNVRVGQAHSIDTAQAGCYVPRTFTYYLRRLINRPGVIRGLLVALQKCHNREKVIAGAIRKSRTEDQKSHSRFIHSYTRVTPI